MYDGYLSTMDDDGSDPLQGYYENIFTLNSIELVRIQSSALSSLSTSVGVWM